MASGKKSAGRQARKSVAGSRRSPSRAAAPPARREATSAAPSRTRRRSAEPPTLFYRLVFEHSLVGMYHTRLDGQILDCNESMAKMLGYASRRELLTRKAAELYPVAADRRAFLARLRRRGVLRNSELCLRRKDGSRMYVLENVSLIRGEGSAPATIHGAMVDITDRKLAELALRDSERRYRLAAAELRQLTQHNERNREATRTRIARELHDELGQSLTALNMDLHWLRQRVNGKLEVPEARIAAMCQLVGRTIQALRRICTDLRPALLDDLGLGAAIEWQAREFQGRTGVRCTASLPRAELRLPRDQATAVFRILQESLTNVARHAQATRVAVALRVRSKTLTLKISDDGVGMMPGRPADAPPLGLLGMRERAMQWHGRVDVRGTPGKGTTVTLHMPLGPPREETTS